MKALVLAAGKGKRLDTLTRLSNKCMLEYQGKPILETLFDNLSKVNAIDEIITVVGYRAEDIINYFGVWYGNKRIKYVIQRELKGLVNAIESAKELIDGDDFLLTLGDEIMSNARHSEIIKDFYNNNYIACLGAVRVENRDLIKKTYTFIYGEQNLVYRLIEKPHKPLNHLMGTGNVIFKNEVFKFIDCVPVHPVRGEKELPDLIQVLIDNGQKVGWFRICDEYTNINTLEDIEKLHQMEGNMILQA